MLTKEYINELKNNINGEFAQLIDQYKTNSSDLVFILKNLGQLPKNFDGSFLFDLTTHKNSEIRLLAVKNIGKLVREQDIPLLFDISKHDQDTNVRREAISSIGRMRTEKAKPYLVETLKNEDPKIVLSSIKQL